MRTIARVATVVGAALAVGAAIVACGGAATPTAVGGAATYNVSCAACHGVDRRGIGPAPALDADRVAALGEAGLGDHVRNGGPQMRGFRDGISDVQVASVYRYLTEGPG